MFLRAYCLQADTFPEITLSLVKQCMNCVSIKDARGNKPKGNELGDLESSGGRSLVLPTQQTRGDWSQHAEATSGTTVARLHID